MIQHLILSVAAFILTTNLVTNDFNSISTELELKHQIIIRNQLIGKITKVHSLTDNRLVVYDHSVNIVYIIDHKGTIIKAVTGVGSGPGEVKRIGDIAVSSYRLYIFDISNRKLVLFNHDGDFLNEIPINTTAFHIVGNDSFVFLFDTININIEKNLVTRVKIDDMTITEVASNSSDFLKEMRVGTSGLFKNITLSSNLLCFVHPYEGIPNCINTESGLSTQILGSLEIFKTPDASSFSNQLDASAITHLSTGLFSYENRLIHTIRDYDAEKDYVVVMNTDNTSSGKVYYDDLGIIGVDAKTGDFYTIEQSDDPDEDIIVINMYRMEN